MMDNSEAISGKRLLQRSALAESEVFRSIDRDSLDQFVSICSAVSLKKGEYLFREGERSNGFYIVHRGAMKLHKISAEGMYLVLKIFNDGESFGELTVLSFDRYPANACAECNTVLLRIDKLGAQRLARSNGAILQCLFNAVANHHKDLVSHMEERVFLTPESRVANWIACEGNRMESAGKSGFAINAAKRSIAEELDMASETFSRKLRILREQGLIEVTGNRIVIVDKLGLKRVAQTTR